MTAPQHSRLTGLLLPCLALGIAGAIGCGDSDGNGADASLPDASLPDASAPDASAPDASAPDGSLPDASLPDASPPAPDGPLDTASVFFSGHSLINLETPNFFQQLGEGEGLTSNYQLQMGLGSAIRFRLACPRNGQEADGSDISYDLSAELARPDAYDTLILTENHNIISMIAYEASTAMALRFVDQFRVGSPNGRLFLFESWIGVGTAPATASAPQLQAWQDRVAREQVAWQCVASKVNETRALASPMRLVPSGQALAALVADVRAGTAPGITSLDQVFADDVHLEHLGNYLMALLHYGVSYQRSPLGVTRTEIRPLFDAAFDVPPATATYLQTLAAIYVNRTFDEAADSQRSTADCLTALASVCVQTPDSNDFQCNTAIPTAFNAVDDAVPGC